jgi:CRISPR/Cas system-associated exonuclease Cas4 (RecB family)
LTALQQVPARAPPKQFDHISYSAVSTFQACPLRFYFRYVLGLPERTISASLVMGTALHRAVQYHFERLMVGETGTDLDALLAVFQDAWESYSEQRILFGKGDDRDTLGRLADRLLTTFLQSDFARPRGDILAVEEQLRGEVVPGCPDVLARVDLIVDTGDELIVSDFKSSRTAWNSYKVQDTAPQLLLYSELVKPMADGRPIKLAFAVVTKTKLPVLTVHDVPFDAQLIERTKKTVEQVWAAIQAGHFYPNPSPANCGTCPYRGPCRRWTG